MGAQEVFCQICGVSFAITRIRTVREPSSAAWYRGRVGQFLAGRLECDKTTGCSLVRRPVPHGHTQAHNSWNQPAYAGDEAITGEDVDPTYSPPPEAPSGADLLEYDSGASDTGSRSADGPDHDLDTSDWTFRASHGGLSFAPSALPLSAADEEIGEPGDRTGTQHVQESPLHEHIAGPDCRSRYGYPGHRIPAPEMRGINVIQCLALKPPDWHPSATDLAFERTSAHFLTGLGLGIDTPAPPRRLNVVPPRHGAAVVNPDLADYTFNPETFTLDDIALPFHPACFELFCQASLRALGRVDVDGLMLYREQTANNARIDLPLCHHRAVRKAQGKTWSHANGTEWLAANPVLIPGLQPLIRAALDVGPAFDVNGSPFPARLVPSGSSDAFSKLPPEIAREILAYLGFRDIAALRLASRVFTHLPTSLWRRLLIDDMPWLYEAWSQHAEPYVWVTQDAEHLHADHAAHAQAVEEHERDLEMRREVVRAEMPEIYYQWVADEEAFEWPPLQPSAEEEEMAELRPVSLPYDRTNWYQLYVEILKNKGALRGLRNRERIWCVVSQLLEKIRDARERAELYG